QAARLRRKRQLGPLIGPGCEGQRGLLVLPLLQQPEGLGQVDDHIYIVGAALEVYRLEERVVDALGEALRYAVVLQGKRYLAVGGRGQQRQQVPRKLVGELAVDAVG